jgi:hypothetical protein
MLKVGTIVSIISTSDPYNGIVVPLTDAPTHATLDQFVSYSPPEVQQDDNNGSWQVQGSKGNTYTVRVRAGQWFCSCPGFGFRRKCRHIEETRNASR